jgi:hypothetical protein
VARFAPRRWDTDQRFTGVRDAQEAAPAVRSLVDAMAGDGWVAEEPELHLLPHLRRAAAELGIEIRSVETLDGILELAIARGTRGRGEAKALVFSLVGSIAEQSTHVRQEGDEFLVVTGSIAKDEPFAAHGHLLRIRLV